MSEYVLETNNLTKVYSKTKALDNLNLKIRKSDIYGFIGNNGAGKSTAIKLIAGLISPSEGEIKLFGDMSLNEARKKIGVVVEGPAFYPYMSARQNIQVQCMLKNITDGTVVDELLKLVGLDSAGNKKAKNFSLGMKQRLGIALALVGDPEFLILDEPINGLDPMGIREFRELLVKLNQQVGITILISSHILGELSKMCTAYGVINNGILVSQITAEELKEKIKPVIKLTVNNPEKTIEILSQNLNINNFELKNNVINIYDSSDRYLEIINSIEKENIIIQSVTKEEADYEDYFIQLMQGGNEVA